MSKQTAKKARDRTEQQRQPLLTPAEAAQYLAVSEAWLERDRATKRRIPYIKISTNVVRYEMAALERFIAEQRRGWAPEREKPN